MACSEYKLLKEKEGCHEWQQQVKEMRDRNFKVREKIQREIHVMKSQVRVAKLQNASQQKLERSQNLDLKIKAQIEYEKENHLKR